MIKRKTFICYCGKTTKDNCKPFESAPLEVGKGFSFCTKPTCNRGSLYTKDDYSEKKSVVSSDNNLYYDGSQPEIDNIINRNLKQVHENSRRSSTIVYQVNNRHPKKKFEVKTKTLYEPRRYETVQHKVSSIKNNNENMEGVSSHRTIIFESVERKNLQCQCYSSKEGSHENEPKFSRPLSRNPSIQSNISILRILAGFEHPKRTLSKTATGKIPPIPPPIDFEDLPEIIF